MLNQNILIKKSVTKSVDNDIEPSILLNFVRTKFVKLGRLARWKDANFRKDFVHTCFCFVLTNNLGVYSLLILYRTQLTRQI